MNQYTLLSPLPLGGHDFQTQLFTCNLTDDFLQGKISAIDYLDYLDSIEIDIDGYVDEISENVELAINHGQLVII